MLSLRGEELASEVGMLYCNRNVNKTSKVRSIHKMNEFGL